MAIRKVKWLKSSAQTVISKKEGRLRMRAWGLYSALTLAGLFCSSAYEMEALAEDLGLRWSFAGAIAGMSCTQIVEPADPHTWGDNFLCAPRDLGFRWSYAGPVQGMFCTQFSEPADPHTWNDNYLCAPRDYGLVWSYAGPRPGMNCVQINEPADPHTWGDNYLCQPNSTTTATQLPIRRSYHADAGNSFLDDGRHAWSDITVSSGGRIDIDLRVDNKVALVGYCFRSGYLFRDAQGNVLHQVSSPQYCVDGSKVLWGQSKRAEHMTVQIPLEVADRVTEIDVAWSPGSKDPLVLAKENLGKGVEVARQVVALIKLFKE